MVRFNFFGRRYRTDVLNGRAKEAHQKSWQRNSYLFKALKEAAENEYEVAVKDRAVRSLFG